MTPMSKTLLGLLLFAVLCPWYSCGLAIQHNETSGEEPLLDPVPDPLVLIVKETKIQKDWGSLA